MLVFVNGVPMNTWPNRNRRHLSELTEIEDVEYVELENTTDDYEETERDY